ncbi:D-mannonate oxidoreductase, NAD-binding [Escherichia coli]|uniref:D-mannonate oxidoreductase, NAD-binding n=1 Tax=Escherichia coli TaxID=562 RepID=A0A376VZ20_ECOLX|nr:D-mannonate oxidoreductase, NAD-binding [Escherichia coli]
MKKGLKAFTVMSCDNVRENGHVAKVAVLGLAQARDPQLAAWIEENVTFPCTMVDRIVPAATPETLQEMLTSWVFTTRAPLPANRSVSG